MDNIDIEIAGLRAAIEDRDKMHAEHIQKIEVRRLRVEAYLAKAIETLEFCDGHLKFMDNYSLISGALFHIRDTLKQIKGAKDGSDSKVQST